MANTQAICNSFKKELLTATHDLSADTLKAAIYLSTATITKATTVYSSTGEAVGTGYTAGGEVVTAATPPGLDTDTAHWTPSEGIAFSNVTLASAFDCILIYNSTKTNKAIAAFTFGSQVVTAGNFTLNMPADNGTTGLIRLS